MSKDLNSNTNDKERLRSGGPRTEEGRASSSQNAKRHGVLSEKIIVLQGEKLAEYKELKRNYHESLRPVGFLECQLVDDIVWSKWRQMRAMRVETATIDEKMDEEREYWERECPTVDDDTRAAHAIKTLVDESNDLQHLSRYETRFHRMYHRSLRQLLELQEKRKLDGETIAAEPPEPPEQSRDPQAASARQRANMNLPNELAGPEPAAAAPAFTPRNPIRTPAAVESPPRITAAA
ncbi:MAG TPA: hypothetical protein VFL57_05740 [Bryobacteraceae bacterium]|nr:hypothetical protein [Bryobacteraceae bacterium]